MPEKLPISRRTLVRASVLGVAAATVVKPMSAAAAETTAATATESTTPMASTAATTTPYVGAGSNAPIRPFRLQEVSLGQGLLQEKRDRMKAFLLQYDERRFLVMFNNQAGRPNPPGVSVPGGWEDGGLLSGHWTGHYMSAVAQAYADAGEQAYKDKLDFMVHELAECQAAITARLGGEPGGPLWIPNYPGYLGALPEDVVIRLGPPRYAQYGGNLDRNTWAPWYTQHKIMRGLLDAYYLTGNETARSVVVKMAEWAHMALTIGDKNHPQYEGPPTRSDLNQMWDTYIAGEFGGANEIFPEIYALTGDAQHLETAKLFDNRESLFDAAVEDRDVLVVENPREIGRRRPARLHANQHVPNFTGYLRVYEQTGEEEYLLAAKHFFGWVVPHRMYANAGTSGNYPGSNNNIEQFQNRDNIANAIADGGAESCTTYNLNKLARNLFFHEPNAEYMDFSERALFNHIAGTRADSTSNSNPQLTYFQPLTPGARKSYGNTGTCCGGSGLESHTKWQETAYFKSADDSALWVNQYIPSTLTWAEKGFVVTQETNFPREDTTRLVVHGSGHLDIKLRVPSWVRKGFDVKVNGKAQHKLKATPNSYVTLKRDWHDGDTIDVTMPFSIHIERAIDRPDTQAIFWGPLLMPILGNPGGGTYRELTLYRHLKLDGDYARAAITAAGTNAAGDPLFTTHGFDLRPWYVGDTQQHSAYFRRVEPQIVFGSIDTGVPNYKRNDGLPNYDVPVSGIESPGTDGPTFLDIVWDNAPFKNHGQFVSTVVHTAKSFVDLGLMTKDERDAVVSAAAKTNKELAP